MYKNRVGLHTLARAMNSCIMGLALCSSVSSTRVRGLALSLKLSNFWNSKRLWDRLCACVDGAIIRPEHMYSIQMIC